MKHRWIKGSSLPMIGCLLPVVALTAAQATPPPKSVEVELNVKKVVVAGGQPTPFGMVGVFEVVAGATAIDRACPSNTNAKGLAYCRMQCDPNDSTEVTMLVKAPGAERFPGYESPVSVPIARTGCKIDRTRISFTYKTLELALAEVLSSDNAIALAVTGRSNLSITEGNFMLLKPFDQSAPALEQLAVERGPSFERFSRIMHDAEISAVKSPSNRDYAKWRKSATDYSIGTRSILLNKAATRSLGDTAGKNIVPITKDPMQLMRARMTLVDELKKKPRKSPFDVELEAQILRTTPLAADQYKLDRNMDWNAINRSQVTKQK